MKQIKFIQNRQGHHICNIRSIKYGVNTIYNLLEIGGSSLSCFASDVISNAYKGERYIEGGVECCIAIVPTKEIQEEERLLVRLPLYAQRYNYQSMPIGIAPAFRIAVSPQMMEEMKWNYIALFHTPVNDDNNNQRVLRLSRGDFDDARSLLRARYCEPEYKYNDKGAIAFLVLKSKDLK